MQIVFGLIRSGLEPTVYHTRDSNHYATDAVLKNIRVRLCKLQKECTRLAVATDKLYQGGVMVRVSGVIDRGFESRSDQTKYYLHLC
jgi:hypothetical protein